MMTSPNTAVRQQKANLRRTILQKSREISVAERQTLSGPVTRILLSYVDAHLADLLARGVAGYRSFDDELDMSAFETGLAARQIRFQPLTLADTLEEVPGLLLVPGVAFDLAGNRLGRGKAYFDQLLLKLRSKKVAFDAIAVAYDHQVIDVVPKEEHDQPVDYICTPDRGLVKCTHSCPPTNNLPS